MIILLLGKMRFIKELNQKVLKVTVEEGFSDYLSCNIVMNKEMTKAWIGQRHLVKKLKKEFEADLAGLKRLDTPGTPSKGLMKKVSDEEALDATAQTRLRSGIGMLLFLMKHSRPDLANPIREISKCMGKGNEEAMKEMKRIVKFVIDTIDYGLKIKPDFSNQDWILETYADANWAGDSETRLSISGFIMFLNKVPIAWRSQAQKNITLSSAESEYVSLSEAVTEIKFVVMMCNKIRIKIKTPTTLRIDNIGAIFMAENASATGRTRHIDVRYHHVREAIYEKMIKIVFMTSEKNLADMFTKNVKEIIYKDNKSSMISK
jgi:hypothetical protein